MPLAILLFLFFLSSEIVPDYCVLQCFSMICAQAGASAQGQCVTADCSRLDFRRIHLKGDCASLMQSELKQIQELVPNRKLC